MFYCQPHVYHWGHRFIYDEATLTVSMIAARLERIKRCEIGESVHPHMRDLERHGTAIDPAINAFETMVLEGQNRNPLMTQAGIGVARVASTSALQVSIHACL